MKILKIIRKHLKYLDIIENIWKHIKNNQKSLKTLENYFSLWYSSLETKYQKDIIFGKRDNIKGSQNKSNNKKNNNFTNNGME